MMRLSQGQLNLLETCPRKFQHVYLDQLATPITPEQQERLRWGSQFHLLMQQRELGLAIAFHTAEGKQLERQVQALVAAAPEIFQPDRFTFRQSEHQLSLSLQDYLLTVVYDLLLLDEQQAQILDWKTYPRPQDQRWLAKNWQTRLYLFVLAETLNYPPEQISMTYWFVQAPADQTIQPEPQHLRFTYSPALHEQVRRELTQLLHQLDQWMQQYEVKPFPQVAEQEGYCEFCHFAVRCQRGQGNWGVQQDSLPNLAEIQEVIL